MARIPSMPCRRSITSAGKASPDRLVTVKSTSPSAPCTLACKRSHHGGQDGVHAKDEQHAENDGERGERGAQFSPGKIAGSEG